MRSAAEQLGRIFEAPAGGVDLGRAALVLAQLDDSGVNVEDYAARLDRYAETIGPRLGRSRDPVVLTSKINEHLFVREGFHGNFKDYYDPRNSFLNYVLDRRTGIPISLSVVYLEVARRLGLPFFGVGLPGHFVVKYDDGVHTLFVDPFRMGSLLDRDGCRELAALTHGQPVELDESDFAAVDERYIILRMLNNLRGIYLNKQQYRKALSVVDLALALLPDSAEEIKQRGLLQFELGRYAAARRDLQRYLDQAPDAEDAEEVKREVEHIVRLQVMMN